jgi:hydrophobic/amphiphilic exporter-1 (mainly G- bacteria), HAE1 family
MGTELIPELSEGEFFFEVKMPEGTSLPATDASCARWKSPAAADRLALQYATVGSRVVSRRHERCNTRAENLGQLNLVMRDRATSPPRPR